MLAAELVPRGCEVSKQVDAGRQEVRNHQHARGPADHASAPSCGNIGLHELKEAGFDDRMLTLGGNPRGQLVQVVVGRLMTAAVGDEKNRSLIGGGHQVSSSALKSTHHS